MASIIELTIYQNNLTPPSIVGKSDFLFNTYVVSTFSQTPGHSIALVLFGAHVFDRG